MSVLYLYLTTNLVQAGHLVRFQLAQFLFCFILLWFRDYLKPVLPSRTVPVNIRYLCIISNLDTPRPRYERVWRCHSLYQQISHHIRDWQLIIQEENAHICIRRRYTLRQAHQTCDHFFAYLCLICQKVGDYRARSRRQPVLDLQTLNNLSSTLTPLKIIGPWLEVWKAGVPGFWCLDRRCFFTRIIP